MKKQIKYSFKVIFVTLMAILVIGMPLSVSADVFDPDELVDVTHYPAKAATCTKNGNIEYWKTEIGMCFRDENLTMLVNESDTVIPAKGHSPATSWTSNADGHWHACNNGCGEKLDYAAHTWDGGTVSAGVTVYKCTVCGATKRLGKANPLKLSTSKMTYKAKALKKSKKSFTVKVTKFKGKVTYSLSDAAKAAKIKVKKAGSSSKSVKYKIIVPKKCKKGIYEVYINAAGGNRFDAGTKTIVIKVK